MAAKRTRRIAQKSSPSLPTYRWRTLPVWMALTGGFVVGWYVCAIGVGKIPSGSWAYWVMFLATTAFAFGLSRLTTTLVVRRRQRQALGNAGPRGLHPNQQMPRPSKGGASTSADSSRTSAPN